MGPDCPAPAFGYHALFQYLNGRPRLVRVLIVDDHPVVISGCKALLMGDTACEVRDAADASALYVLMPMRV